MLFISPILNLVIIGLLVKGIPLSKHSTEGDHQTTKENKRREEKRPTKTKMGKQC